MYWMCYSVSHWFVSSADAFPWLIILLLLLLNHSSAVSFKIYIVFFFSPTFIVVSLGSVSVESNVNVKLNCYDCHSEWQFEKPGELKQIRLCDHAYAYIFGSITDSKKIKNKKEEAKKPSGTHSEFKLYKHYTMCGENTL